MVLAPHADYVRLLYSTQEKGKYGVFHIHELSYLSVILVISLSEKDRMRQDEKDRSVLRGHRSQQRWGNLSDTGFSFQWEKCKIPVFSSRKLEAQLSMLYVGPGQILQPGVEVSSNLNDPYSQGLPKLPQPESEIPNSLNDPYIISIARGSLSSSNQD